jgi:hypothetical protein
METIIGFFADVLRWLHNPPEFWAAIMPFMFMLGIGNPGGKPPGGDDDDDDDDDGPKGPEMIEIPSMGAVTAEMMQAYLTYGPELAAQMWADQQKYMPKQAAMAYALSKIFVPKQMELALEQMKTYLPQYQELLLAAEQKQRDTELDYVLEKAGLLPEIRTAAEDPATTAMRNELSSQISDELAMGTQLTGEQERQVAQEQRSSEAARGIAEGQGSANRESVTRALEGMELQNQRQQKASGYLAAEQSAAVDPFLALLGRPTTTVGNAQSTMRGGLQQPTMAGTTPRSADILQPANSAYNSALTGAQIAQQNQMYALTYELARQNAIAAEVPFNV